MALFGKGGAALIPMLNKLGKEQAAVNDEAHRFGLIIGTSTGQVSAEAKERIEELHMVLKGMGFSLLGAVLPALSDLIGKLQSVATNMNLPDLAAQFGQKVTGAIHLLGDALDFATTHVGLLKTALASLAGMKVAAIAIPVIGDLASGGIANVGKGLDKLTVGFLGLEKVLPALAKFGAWLKYTASFVGMMAAEEGIGAAATYVFGGALAAIGGPITLAIAALVGLGIAIFKFRDATFSLGGTTYKLRDTWNAAWIAMGWGLSWIGKQFSSLVGMLKSLWSGLIGFFAGSSVVKVISGVFGAAFEWIQGMLGKMTPQWVTKALDEAKKQRLSKDPGTLSPLSTMKPVPGLPAPDTSGLGKQTESPVGKLLANLQEKLDESKQTLAAAGLEEEAQRKVAAANKASNEIMKLGEEIAKQTGAKTKDYASLVDATTQSLIREKNAQISDNEEKTTLLNLLGTTSRASALSIAQSGLMVQAMDKGSDAVLRQTAVTQAWNELREKGAGLAQILTRSQDIYAESVAKESQSIQGNIISLQQELAARKIVNDAILDSADAQDEAALKAKLYALDVQIAGAAAGGLRDKLLAQRAAMVDLNTEEKRKSDLENARKYDPAKEYRDQEKSIDDAAAALAQFQKNGMLTYDQTLQVTMAHQENFNRLIDATVKGLLSQNNAASGMKAFFLDMQKQAITAGQVIYDALKSAFDKLSENLTQLVTGGKTSFAKMFQDIGRQMVNSTIQGAMQKGLGALGKALPASTGGPQSGIQKGLGALGKVLPASIGGPLSKALAGKPDGSDASRALWVRMASASGSALPNFGGAGGIGGKGGLSGVGGAALGVGTGVMGSGATSLGGDGGLGGAFGISPGIDGKGITALMRMGDIRGDAAGSLAVRDPTDLLGGWSPGDGEGGGGALAGGLGDAITGIGPDQNDGGGDSGGGDGGAGSAAVGIGGGLISMLGGIFGGGNKTKPDGSKNNPLWVQMAAGGGGAGILGAIGGGSTDQTGNSGGSGSGGSSKASGILGFLGSLFKNGSSDGSGGDSGGGGFAAGGPISGPGTGTSDSISARLSNGEFVVRAAPAAKFKGLLQHINKGGKVHKTPGFASGGWVGYANGGTVTSPSSAYTMGETTSTMAAASGQIAGNTTARRGQGSMGNTAYYTIDARGTDPVLTEQRTRTAIIAAHNSAASLGVQLNAERLRRTPQR
jgi:hypothetical protein